MTQTPVAKATTAVVGTPAPTPSGAVTPREPVQPAKPSKTVTLTKTEGEPWLVTFSPDVKQRDINQLIIALRVQFRRKRIRRDLNRRRELRLKETTNG